MSIQSLSIVVPTRGCVNNCKFCVSKMHGNNYVYAGINKEAYIKRIKRAVNNGVDNLIFTGTGEILQNDSFLNRMVEILDVLNHPFSNVEIQTTGVMMCTKDSVSGLVSMNYRVSVLLHRLRVNTISLSVSDLFDDENNWNIIGTPAKLRIPLQDLCDNLKRDFNIRLSLNMLKHYDRFMQSSLKEIFYKAHELGARFVTFRKMYASGSSEESIWARNNSADDILIKSISKYIRMNGTHLYKLPFGAEVYSIHGLSVAVDDDCMSKENNDDLKYLIIREDGHLYCKWDDEGSIIF